MRIRPRWLICSSDVTSLFQKGLRTVASASSVHMQSSRRVEHLYKTERPSRRRRRTTSHVSRDRCAIQNNHENNPPGAGHRGLRPRRYLETFQRSRATLCECSARYLLNKISPLSLSEDSTRRAQDGSRGRGPAQRRAQEQGEGTSTSDTDITQTSPRPQCSASLSSQPTQASRRPARPCSGGSRPSGTYGSGARRRVD